MESELAQLIGAVETALEDTEREYGMLPFFVRPLVRRGFVKRTGRDFAGWRAVLGDARRGVKVEWLGDALDALAEHYRGAPERARRGMGATSAELELVEQRSLARAKAVLALRDHLRMSSS